MNKQSQPHPRDINRTDASVRPRPTSERRAIAVKCSQKPTHEPTRKDQFSHELDQGGHVLTIDLEGLGKNIGPCMDYLGSRLDEPVKVKKNQVKLGRTSARAAKLLLHKFLRQLRLEGYRVLVVHSGLIEVHAPEKVRERPVRATQGSKPSAWETIPDLWYTAPPGMIRPGRRSERETKRRMRGL
jgi:hypothetical protein